MEDCLFCAIVAGTAEASIVHEDAYTLAFMNLRQTNPGHVLVIPKAHIEQIYTLDAENGAALMQTVVHVARGIRRAFQSDGLNIWQSNGAAAGQEIPHLHIHLLPRQYDDNRLQFYTQLPPPEQRSYLNHLADQIRRVLK